MISLLVLLSVQLITLHIYLQRRMLYHAILNLVTLATCSIAVQLVDPLYTPVVGFFMIILAAMLVIETYQRKDRNDS